MAKVIDVYGNCVEVSPKNGTDFSLEELQTVVGGYIEIVYLDDGEIMVVNEEGKLNGLSVNGVATSYLLTHSDCNDIIVGDVIVCDSCQVR